MEQEMLDFGFTKSKPLFLQTNNTLPEYKDFLEKISDYLATVSDPDEKQQITLTRRKVFLKDLFNENSMISFKIDTVIEEYPEFFTSPASTRFHGAYSGGLFDHSIGVLYAGMNSSNIYGLEIKDIDLIAFLFHDLCKVGFYIKSQKWKKDASTGNKWMSYEGYECNNDMPQILHGPESLRRLLNCNISISEPWQLAISYHMGAFDAGTDEKAKFSKMCERFPEVLLLHHADMISTKIYHL